MNRTIDQVLLAVATVGLLVAIRHILGPQTALVGALTLVVGIIITFFGERILDGQPNPLKAILTKSVGIIILVAGANLLMDHYSLDYWYIFGIFAIIIFNTHHFISERF